MSHSQNQAFGLKSKSILGVVRVAMGIVLILAAGRQLVGALKQLEGQKISVRAIPLTMASALYVGGMVSFAGFWRRILEEWGRELRPLVFLEAYFVSQLGKYLPGKAWVLLIRCGILSRSMVSKAEIVASSVYETLAVMAAGSITALFGLLLSGSIKPAIIWMAVGLTCAVTIPVQPWIFDRLLRYGMLPFQRFGAEPAPNVSYQMLARGACRLIVGWAMVGLSLLAVAQSLSLPVADISVVLLLCGGMALSIAGGFMIVVVPAGLGIREWILVQTLGPVFGVGNAVLLAVASRVVNILTEILAAGCLFLVARWNEIHD